MSGPRTYVEHRSAAGRCGRCRAKLRAVFDVEVSAAPGSAGARYAIVYPDGARSRLWSYGALFEALRLYCPRCERRVSLRPIAGRVTGRECDARCMYAIGPACECSCGGANHGAGHQAALTMGGAPCVVPEVETIALF